MNIVISLNQLSLAAILAFEVCRATVCSHLGNVSEYCILETGFDKRLEAL